MARRYRVVAEVEQGRDASPNVTLDIGDRVSVAYNANPSAFVGNVTEVTPIMTAEDALEKIKNLCHNGEGTQRIMDIVTRYRASAGPQ